MRLCKLLNSKKIPDWNKIENRISHLTYQNYQNAYAKEYAKEKLKNTKSLKYIADIPHMIAEPAKMVNNGLMIKDNGGKFVYWNVAKYKKEWYAIEVDYCSLFNNEETSNKYMRRMKHKMGILRKYLRSPINLVQFLPFRMNPAIYRVGLQEQFSVGFVDVRYGYRFKS